METNTAPDVGTLVEYGSNSFGTGPGQYRVDSWLRVVPARPPADPADFEATLTEILFEGCQELETGVGKARMQFCLREEATHLSLTGIGGAIAPVTEVTVTGTVEGVWSPKHVAEARESARRRGAAHTMIF